MIKPEKKLSLVEIGSFLKDYPSWSMVEGRLERDYKFTDFARSMLFLNKIVNPIQEFDLYPRIVITYNLVHVSLLNPHTGVLTQSDLDLAKAMDDLSGLQDQTNPGIPV